MFISILFSATMGLLVSMGFILFSILRAKYPARGKNYYVNLLLDDLPLVLCGAVGVFLGVFICFRNANSIRDVDGLSVSAYGLSIFVILLIAAIVEAIVKTERESKIEFDKALAEIEEEYPDFYKDEELKKRVFKKLRELRHEADFNSNGLPTNYYRYKRHKIIDEAKRIIEKTL